MDKPTMARFRQYAHEMIAGTRVHLVGPQDGELLLWLLEEQERTSARLDALEAHQAEQRSAHQALEAAVEELWDRVASQRATIEALAEENDTLHAQLDRQAAAVIAGVFDLQRRQS